MSFPASFWEFSMYIVGLTEALRQMCQAVRGARINLRLWIQLTFCIGNCKYGNCVAGTHLIVGYFGFALI